MGLKEGTILSNYIVDATDNAATNAKWTSTTVQNYTVPAGCRWFLTGGYVTRDTNTGTATLTVDVYDAATNLVLHLDEAVAGTGTTTYPDPTYTGYINFPLPMGAGWYVNITIGEAQGAAAAATCMVREVHGL
jgi:hypothetical protein